MMPILAQISALLEIECNDASKVMGKPDDLKLKSSMTLFALASSKESVFQQVLDKYFCGKMDHRTLKLLGMPFEGHKENSPKKHEERIIQIPDDNIQSIRNRYPGGLHFVVGDTHVMSMHFCMILQNTIRKTTLFLDSI